MELDYHYYAIYRLAQLAGFNNNDAITIAYASKYVDDSTESEPIQPFPGQYFDTVRTAHYDLGAFDWNIQKKIYMPFHFLPQKIRWQSPASFSYITRPATGGSNELATMLITAALSENLKRFRLIRLGIALHTVADTFSHFGFSGRHHDENNVGRIWHAKKDGGWKLQPFESFVADIFVPRIGHVEAFKFPDQPYLKWRYTNDGGSRKTRDNHTFCMKGAGLIYRFLRKAYDPEAGTSKLQQDHPDDYLTIDRLFKKRGSLISRCKNWKSYTGAPEYDRRKWRREALKGDVDWDGMSRSDLKAHTKNLTGKTNFDQSNWAYFHRAALKQRSAVIGWLN